MTGGGLFRLVVTVLIVGTVLALSRCQQKTTPNQSAVEYLNWHDTVAYVGIAVCKSCHGDIHGTFQHTGMGRSFGKATEERSAGNFHQEFILRDSLLDLNYHPFWRGDSLVLLEYRLRDGDTVHKLVKKINYIVGSGQHTNSHMVEVNGRVFQAPFTWYAQEGRLDLPPGFEDGQNSRFSRPIGLECMSCHNAMPVGFVAGSENKFSHLPEGIDCERCHGPGELHVQRIQRGVLVDTSQEIDPSIVNPKRLPAQLQFEICQRCHLQGNPVLKPGKSFFDFKPGMRLSEVMEVYLPRYEGDENTFIMASHVDRFKQSACFKNSEGFNCTTCHNPHLSVQATNQIRFNQACESCHGEAQAQIACTEVPTRLAERDYNCVSCHMPPSSTADIPHVSVHDHYIRVIDTNDRVEEEPKPNFTGLFAINSENPSPRSKALAYLQQFERFRARSFYLDSARFWLNQIALEPAEELALWVYYYHLAAQPQKLTGKIRAEGSEKVLSAWSEKTLDNFDAWTCYRSGEAYYQLADYQNAERFYAQACRLAPLVLEFRNKYATALLKTGKRQLAKENFKNILRELPQHREALNNLAFLALQNGDLLEARKYLNRLTKHHPDYEQAWLNKANLAAREQNLQKMRAALAEVLRINPQNESARQLYSRLSNPS